MIVNVPNDRWDVVEAGMQAARDVKLGVPAENPFDDDYVEHDYWKLGFMAVEHGWDVEF